MMGIQAGTHAAIIPDPISRMTTMVTGTIASGKTLVANKT